MSHPGASYSTSIGPTASSASSEDGSRMSLPSISNLLGIADAVRPSSSHERERNTTYYDSTSQAKRARYDATSGARPYDASPSSTHRSADSSHRPPPTLPYARYSPLMADVQAAPINPTYEMDIDHETKRHSSHSQAPGYDASPYQKGHAASPSATSDSSLYSPTTSMHRQLGPYGAGPQAFAPGVPVGPYPTSGMPTTNPWEHHHYIGSSAQQGLYPPLPDRYICQTCNKAFSRPSSLKIHSHSHTGEKPFKCPHAGCNKAFSVKSNMKRHEKGCHTGGAQVVPGAYMSEDI